MAEGCQAAARVYQTENMGVLSIQDMLAYFEKRGAMRVSDLHIKVGSPPAYRIDGNLAYLKGDPVSPETAKQLIYPLLSDDNLQKFHSENNVDCSYRVGSL
jgi:twitching motility protein PilT